MKHYRRKISGNPIRGWLAVIFTMLLLYGCTSVDPEPAASGDTAEAENSAPERVEAAPEASKTKVKSPRPDQYPVKSFDKETLYQLLAAELAGYRGQYDTAMDNYIKAAEATRDPGVAARATRLASYLKRDDAAATAARIWAEAEPDSLDAHRHAADQLMKAGDLEGAIHHMEAVKRLGGLANFEVFAYRAANLDQESRNALLTTLSAMLADYPGDRQLMFAKAVLLEQSGQYQKAIEIANQLLAEEKDVNAIILKINGLKELNRTDEAIEFLVSAVESMPDNRRLRLVYARYLFEADRLDDARSQYRSILERSPDDGDILFALALISMEQEDDAEAKKYLHRMVDEDRRAGEAHFYLGSIAEKNGDIPAAIRHYKKAGGGYEFLPAQARVAGLMTEQGRVPEARAYLDNLRDQYPGRHDELIQLEAQILSEQGLESEALDVLDRAIAADPDNIDLLYFRAMTGHQFGHLDILEQDLRRILELEPDNADALNALGYTLTDQTDRHEEALALIQQALEIKPGEAAYIDSMGWVQFKLKNYEAAERHLRRALEMMPDPEVAAHLGEVLWVMGEKDKARKVWNEALERAPDSEILESVINRLRDR